MLVRLQGLQEAQEPRALRQALATLFQEKRGNMKLENLLGETCMSCGARMFPFSNPERYICLREQEHSRYVTGRASGRKRTSESNLHAIPGQMSFLRDAATFRGDDVDLPESA